MLVSFSIENFRNFKERTVFSLLPASGRTSRHIAPVKIGGYDNLSVLPGALIYGANNSGKSNLLAAFAALKQLVKESGQFNSDKKISAYDPFYFDRISRKEPGRFAVSFIASNGIWYDYKVSLNESQILEEELIRYRKSPSGKTTRQTLYTRTENTPKFGETLTGNKKIRVASNQLLLSRGDIEGNPELKTVYSFFSDSMVLQLAETEYLNFSNQTYAEFAAKNKDSDIVLLTNKIINQADPNLLSLEPIQSEQPSVVFSKNVPDLLKERILDKLKNNLVSIHDEYEGAQKLGTLSMSFYKQSTGMRKLVAVLPLILNVLKNGSLLFLDELDTSLHTELTAFICGLFSNPKINLHRAQLVFTTHNITLLNRRLFDKDQIFITEKNETGQTELSAFSDYNFSNLRSESLAQYYETGRLGGLPKLYFPYIDDLIVGFVKNTADSHEKEPSKSRL